MQANGCRPRRSTIGYRQVVLPNQRAVTDRRASARGQTTQLTVPVSRKQEGFWEDWVGVCMPSQLGPERVKEEFKRAQVNFLFTSHQGQSEAKSNTPV